MADNLSEKDVEKLLNDPSAENRADTADKLSGQFEAGDLSDNERKLAEEIFRIMAKDAADMVREALAKNLKAAPNLPADVAKSLAADVSDTVSAPVLEFSPALSDDDLIEILNTQNASKQLAVARRSTVSERVSDAIVETGNEAAVVSLVENEGAEISEKTLNKVVDKYGNNERVQRPLVHRNSLPVTVAERLVAKVSDSLREYLVTHHELPAELATDLVLQSRERATIGLLSRGAEEVDVEQLVRQLRDNGRLTPSIILRALCVGDIAFFESAMAVLADVPLLNARLVIHDEGELGLKSIYEKSKLPRALYPAFRSAMDLVLDAELERSDADPEHHMRLMLERVLTQLDDVVDEFGLENVDYLLTKLNKLADAEHEHRAV